MTRISQVNPSNKFGAVKTLYGGRVYHSKFEAEVARELDLRVMAKDILGWMPQVKIDLKSHDEHICFYVIDFVATYPDGHREYIEVKGVSLSTWRLKWRLLEVQLQYTDPNATMSVYVQGTSNKVIRGVVHHR